jgi:hypothetical protein
MRPPAPAVPNPAGNRNVQYDWQRFWIPQAGAPELSDAGDLLGPAEVSLRSEPDGIQPH